MTQTKKNKCKVRKTRKMKGGRNYSLTSLNIRTQLPDDIHLYKSLTKLVCEYSQLTSLPENLPSSLRILNCGNNQLTSLPENLPSSLTELYCSNNQLTSLPENLPVSLTILYCDNNQLTSLPENLPVSLTLLSCNNNQLTSLPENLPVSLTKLYCMYNQLESLPLSILELDDSVLLSFTYNTFTRSLDYNYNSLKELREKYFVKELREKYFEHLIDSDEITINKNQTTYDTISLEDVNIVDYIHDDSKNIVLQFNSTFHLSNKDVLENLIDKTDRDNNSLVYICKKVYSSLNITEEQLKDKTIYFKLKIIGLFGLVKVSEMKKIINEKHQYYIIEPTEEIAPTVVNYNYFNNK